MIYKIICNVIYLADLQILDPKELELFYRNLHEIIKKFTNIIYIVLH